MISVARPLPLSAVLSGSGEDDRDRDNWRETVLLSFAPDPDTRAFGEDDRDRDNGRETVLLSFAPDPDTRAFFRIGAAEEWPVW